MGAASCSLSIDNLCLALSVIFIKSDDLVKISYSEKHQQVFWPSVIQIGKHISSVPRA